MAKTFKLRILTMDKIVYDGEAIKLLTKAKNGDIEFLVNCAPCIASLVPCITTIVNEKNEKLRYFTSNGIVNIKENKITICCDSAESKNDIDVDRAEKSKERAERRLEKRDQYDVERAKLSLLRANLRIKLHDMK